MSADVIASFRDAMRAHGLEPAQEIIPDGQLHRVRWTADKKGSRNGAYVLHADDKPAGFFECHKRRIRQTWSANGHKLTPAQRKDFAVKADAARKEREREERERHYLAAEQAKAILARCQDGTPDHPYLARKGISPHGLKIDPEGRLVVPLQDPKGKIWSFQTIAPDGSKLFLKGGRKKGLFHLLGEPGDALIICEGFATAASIREATELPVAIAFDCGNLEPVAKALRKRLPLARIVIAADDDHATEGNPGMSKAQAAAEIIGASVAVPDFGDAAERGTDFNDLATAQGAHAVAKAIADALAELDALNDEPEAGAVSEVHAAVKAAPQADDWEEPLLRAIEELNQRYFVATFSGQTVVASLEHDEGLQRERLVFSKPQDIRLKFAHRHYVVGFTAKGNPVQKGLGEAWLEHRKRRNYDRIALIPKGKVPPDVFNLWRGFGVEPKPGAWPRIEEHLLEVVCSDNQRDYAWLINWFAYCVQNPERQAEVAVVLRGLKGTGKGAVGKIMLRLFRSHGMQISNPRHLTGNFNAHLVDTLALFVDEAFWAGDKTGEGVLKSMVTEDSVPVEPKHVNTFSTRNRLKIIVASNADWVVPATPDERRYFVLNVSDRRRGEKDYFDKLFAAIEGDELGAFLHHLISLDISDFNHRNPPHTDALNEQKVASLDSVASFWYDCLINGELVETGIEGWPEHVPIQQLHAAYLDFAQNHGDRHPLSDARMGERLAKFMPKKRLKRVRPRESWEGNPRPIRYALPRLDECRKAFAVAMNIANPVWPKCDDDGGDE